MTKHKPEINSGAADEIALAGGGVKEPVGFQDEMHFVRQGVFDVKEKEEIYEGSAKPSFVYLMSSFISKNRST